MENGKVFDHISNLLNLMALVNVVPEGTAVYDTDTGDMLELVPMIRKANNDLQWLLAQVGAAAKTVEQKGPDTEQAQAKDGEISKAKFVDEFIKRKHEMMAVHGDCVNRADAATNEFVQWLKDAVGKASKDEINEFLAYEGTEIDADDKGAVSSARIVKSSGVGTLIDLICMACDYLK